MTADTPLNVNDVLKTIRDVPDDGLGPDQFKTGEGIIFNIRKIPPLLMHDVQESLKPPKPPKVRDDDKETWEENPDDPEYLEAMAAYNTARGESMNALLLVRGTSVAHLPDVYSADGQGPEDTAWIEDLQETFPALNIPDSKRRRYYLWLRYVALTDMQEFMALVKKVGSKNGMTFESEVVQAVESF